MKTRSGHLINEDSMSTHEVQDSTQDIEQDSGSEQSEFDSNENVPAIALPHNVLQQIIATLQNQNSQKNVTIGQKSTDNILKHLREQIPSITLQSTPQTIKNFVK